MTLHIGFTGTQEGLTAAQRKRLRNEVIKQGHGRHHHGDCVGADAEFHEIIRTVFGSQSYIVGHPPDVNTKRAFCDFDYYRKAKPYMERNTDIVMKSDVVLACPKEFDEQQRSGTWSTIRRARAAARSLVIIFPDGSVKREASSSKPTGWLRKPGV